LRIHAFGIALCGAQRPPGHYRRSTKCEY
jgi:hypothetical protein